jgi:hypothetical protein
MVCRSGYTLPATPSSQPGLCSLIALCPAIFVADARNPTRRLRAAGLRDDAASEPEDRSQPGALVEPGAVPRKVVKPTVGDSPGSALPASRSSSWPDQARSSWRDRRSPPQAVPPPRHPGAGYTPARRALIEVATDLPHAGTGHSDPARLHRGPAEPVRNSGRKAQVGSQAIA